MTTLEFLKKKGQLTEKQEALLLKLEAQQEQYESKITFYKTNTNKKFLVKQINQIDEL